MGPVPLTDPRLAIVRIVNNHYLLPAPQCMTITMARLKKLTENVQPFKDAQDRYIMLDLALRDMQENGIVYVDGKTVKVNMWHDFIATRVFVPYAKCNGPFSPDPIEPGSPSFKYSLKHWLQTRAPVATT